MKFKFISLLSAAAIFLSFSGCSSENENISKTITGEPLSASVGQYVEEEVLIPVEILENGMSELFLCNSLPAFIENGNNYLYHENESQTAFTAESLSFPKENISVYDQAGSANGTFYMLYVDYDSMQDEKIPEIHCGYKTPNSTWKSFSIGELYPVELECASDGRLFMHGFDSQYQNTIYEIDPDKEIITDIFTFPGPDAVSIDIVGDYIVSVVGDSICFYNYKTNRTEETPKVIERFSQEQKLGEALNHGTQNFDICAGEKGTMYIACESGLYRYVLNGNQIEQLIDGVDCHISNPAWTIDSVLQESDDTLLIAYKNGRIMRYYYDNNFGNSYDSELEIFSLAANETVMNTIAEYNLKYPNVKVNYKTAERNNTNYESALAQLSAALYSNDPPDVIITDDLTVSYMIQDGSLMDLSEQEKNILPENGVLENIAKPKQNEKWYTMPCRFRLPYIAGNKTELNSLSNTSDLLRSCKKDLLKDEGNVLFFDYTPKDLLQALLPFAWNSLVTESGVDTKATAQFLSDCKEYYKTVLQKPASYVATTHTIGISLLYSYFNVACGTVNSLNDLLCLNALPKADGSLTYSMDQISQNSFIPSCSLSISANSKNKENAVRFLNMAVSYDLQSIKSEDGFPVNLDVIKRFSERRYGAYSTADNHLYSDDHWTFIRKLSEEEYNDFYSMITRLNSPVVDNGAIKEIFLTYGSDCIDSNITPETAAAMIAEALDPA